MFFWIFTLGWRSRSRTYRYILFHPFGGSEMVCGFYLQDIHFVAPTGLEKMFVFFPGGPLALLAAPRALTGRPFRPWRRMRAVRSSKFVEIGGICV